jgi:hypothetical protein
MAARRTVRPTSSWFQKTDSQDPKTPSSQDVTAASSQTTPKAKRYQVTVYLEKQDILALDRLIQEEFDRTDERPDRSEMVRLAIRELVKSREQQQSNGD